MTCKNCGAELENGAKFCGSCGAVVENTSDSCAKSYETQVETVVSSPKTTVNKTKLLVFGIIALATSSGILGIIFGAIAKKMGKTVLAETGSLTGKAKAGYILGKLGLVFGIICTILTVISVIIWGIVIAQGISSSYGIHIY